MDSAQRPAFLHVVLANWLTHMEMVQHISSKASDRIASRCDRISLSHFTRPSDRRGGLRARLIEASIQPRG